MAPSADDAAWEGDALAHAEYGAAADDNDVVDPRERWLPSIPVLAAAAFIGITSGVGWLTFGPKSSASGSWMPPASAAQTAASTAPMSNDGDLAKTVRELDALKKKVTELAATNQQMAATIASLQASHQELRQRTLALQLQGWHANPAVMKYRVVPQQKVASTTPPARPPGARADARPAPMPGEGGPLALTAPRP